ncbi:MAG TPA: hypothetical protein VH619_12040 [Verrucomicrobiae bacterium]|nr:hypothetical protein [Verrucomicrobiae bacterium]
MMVQSVAGLAAKAVNEGRGDELVWVNNGDGDLEKWYARLFVQHPDLAAAGTYEPWELVDRYAKRGIIKGYILYRCDKSRGENKADRRGMNYSVNVATSLAGLMDGIIVDEGLEKEAKAHGLRRLLDVREKTQLWCFQTYKDQFNRRMLCFQNPQMPYVRDLAIAEKAFTAYGNDEPSRMAMAWLEPLSPILGWNGGDEFETTDLSSGFGEIQTSTDWCLNLPVLMAGTEKLDLPRATRFDPRRIDWNDSRSAVFFIDTDGDNVQSMVGNFFSNKSYWGNSDRGKIPFGWSCCFAQLAQLCPEAIEYGLATRTTNDWFIEWGGGYYYPDHFGRGRTNRWELLAEHSRRTWELMKKTNTRIIGFNFTQFDSPDAHKACEVFARQTDGLMAILVFQYSAYEAGAGKTFWVEDRSGIEVPVITARYSIWEHANNRERAGTPAKISRDIQRTVENTQAGELPRYDWVIDHVWSYFKHASGADEDAENMPQENGAGEGGVRGYSPVTWCAERLPASIRVVSPEELVWRIRMKHDPSQTKKLISRFQ